MLLELMRNIWTVLIDTAFWLLIGLLAAGFIKVYISASAMQRWVGGRGFAAVARAALLGAPLPLCSCGVLPVAIGLHRGGASKEATVSFLISTPETSVDSIAVTYALMGPLMAVYRPVAALLSAMITGMLTALVDDPATAKLTEPAASAVQACCAHEAIAVVPVEKAMAVSEASCCAAIAEPVVASCCAAEAASTEHSYHHAALQFASKCFTAIRYAGAELLDDIALWMAVGIVVAGVMLSFVPPGLIADYGQGIGAMLMMLVIGIPMYICAVASTPIAAGLLLAGVSPGAVLIFLLVGPATNIASFALVRRELGNKVTAVYFAGIASVSLMMGVLLEWLLKAFDLNINASLGHAHAMLPQWLSVASAVLLVVLAIKPLRRKLLPALG